MPGTSISSQFVSTLLTILQLIRVLPAWIDGHPSKDFWLCKAAPLSCLPVYTIAQRIYEHVPACRRTTLLFLREASPTPVIFQLLVQKNVTSNIFVYRSTIVSFGLHSRWVHPLMYRLRNDVGSSRSTFLINVFHMAVTLCFFPSILMSSTKTDRTNPCFRWTNVQSQFGIFPIQVLTKLPPNVFPITIWLMDDHINFVQEVPRDLQCLPKISVTYYVVEDLPIRLAILTTNFWATWEHPPIFPECRQMLHQLRVRHNLVIFQKKPLLFKRQSLGTQTSLAQWKLRGPQSRLLQCHHGARLCFCIFVILVLTLAFLRWQMFINVAKWTFFLSPCASRITSFLLLTFSKLPCRNRLELFPIHSPLQLLHLEFSSLGAKE